MPGRLLQAYISMHPRMQAEQLLEEILAASLPHWSGKRGAAQRKRTISQLERTAQGRRAAGPTVARTGEEVRRWLAHHGGIDARERPGRDHRYPEPVRRALPAAFSRDQGFQEALEQALGPDEGRP